MRVESMAGIAGEGRRRSAHVIVLGNEKGGSGKSTLAMHVAVALLKSGQRVATIDLDSRQKSFTRYVENRRITAGKTGVPLEQSRHYAIERGTHNSIDRNEQDEFAAFAAAVTEAEPAHDFLVIDTPGSDSYLMRLAHAMADTLITPLNDSFIDFDVLARVDAETFETTAVSQYGEVVREARRQRRLADGGTTDWVVVRNRLGQFATKNGRNLERGMAALAAKLGFRSVDGVSERVIFRELFPRGLTILDELDRRTALADLSLSHLAARQEVRALLAALRLPIDERGRRRVEAREIWARSSGTALDDDELLAGE